ncbi:hypothetical protein [Candidatus Phycosocius bacilliformis]|nr:hypothetical protein [Candidatus Phycosocius bacilliformis]
MNTGDRNGKTQSPRKIPGMGDGQNERQPTIVVYDSKLNVVASGGINGQPIQNALASISPFGIENISSPRLLELADLLTTTYGKPSSVQQLVETLKAS